MPQLVPALTHLSVLRQNPVPFSDSGTKIRILPLKSVWDAGQIADLEDNLTRLISPFSKRDAFNISISLKALPDVKNEELKIKAPSFLSPTKVFDSRQSRCTGQHQNTIPVQTNSNRQRENTKSRVVMARPEYGLTRPCYTNYSGSTRLRVIADQYRNRPTILRLPKMNTASRRPDRPQNQNESSVPSRYRTRLSANAAKKSIELQ